MGSSIKNIAEISDADNALDQEDEDSMPNDNPADDNEGDNDEIR